MSDFWEYFRKTFRQRRIAAGMSQRVVAECLHISRSAYTYYESGRVKPRLEMILKLMEILQIPISAFFPTDEEP